MPTPTTKRARKEALTQPKAKAGTGPLPVNRYSGAGDIARTICGLRRYQVVAPRTLNAALAPTPQGPVSIEYAPSHAVDGGQIAHGRNVFSTANALGFLEREARQMMGDFHDDGPTSQHIGPLEAAWRLWDREIGERCTIETEAEKVYGPGAKLWT